MTFTTRFRGRRAAPIEADGRPRYRIKSKTENIERVVTEEQISRLG